MIEWWITSPQLHVSVTAESYSALNKEEEKKGVVVMKLKRSIAISICVLLLIIRVPEIISVLGGKRNASTQILQLISNESPVLHAAAQFVFLSEDKIER